MVLVAETEVNMIIIQRENRQRTRNKNGRKGRQSPSARQHEKAILPQSPRVVLKGRLGKGGVLALTARGATAILSHTSTTLREERVL